MDEDYDEDILSEDELTEEDLELIKIFEEEEQAEKEFKKLCDVYEKLINYCKEYFCNILNECKLEDFWNFIDYLDSKK